MKTQNPAISVAIIGVQKGASTSLHRYMAMHPAFCTHEKLEFAWFVRDEEYRKGYDFAFSNYLSGCDEGKQVLVKNVGLMYWKSAIKRMHAHNPEMKLIAMLRNPVERAYSAYHYACLVGTEDKTTFEEALNAGIDRFSNPIDRGLVDYLGRGHYFLQLQNLFQFFPQEQVLVLLQDDLKEDPAAVLRKCFSFCNVDESFVPDFSVRFNEAGRSKHKGLMKFLRRNRVLRKVAGLFLPKKVRGKLMSGAAAAGREKLSVQPMREETRKMLVEYYRPINKELEDLLGRDLSAWNR